MKYKRYTQLGGTGVFTGEWACIDGLIECIIDATLTTYSVDNKDDIVHYCTDVYNTYQIPIMNSPISGSTLRDLVATGGTSAGFIIYFPHDAAHAALFFVVIGGTRIILGAADGIAVGLKNGLSYTIEKWLGVPRQQMTGAKPKKNPKK